MGRFLPYFATAAITATIMVVLSFFVPEPDQARSTLCVGLIVGVVIAAIPIYDIDSWSLAKRSLMHLLVMVLTVLPLVLYAGWFNVPVSIGVFLLFGVVGWIVGFLIYRIQEKKTNARSK